MSAGAPVTWSPAALRGALAARVRGTGIPEAPQIPGPAGAPSQTAQRAYAVRLDGAESGTLPGRSGASIEIRHRVAVDLIHAARPLAGPDVWDQALADELAVRRALLLSTDDSLRAIEHRIRWISADAPILDGGGAYRRSTLRFEVTVLECLE